MCSELVNRNVPSVGVCNVDVQNKMGQRSSRRVVNVSQCSPPRDSG